MNIDNLSFIPLVLSLTALLHVIFFLLRPTLLVDLYRLSTFTP